MYNMSMELAPMRLLFKALCWQTVRLHLNSGQCARLTAPMLVMAGPARTAMIAYRSSQHPAMAHIACAPSLPWNQRQRARHQAHCVCVDVTVLVAALRWGEHDQQGSCKQ